MKVNKYIKIEKQFEKLKKQFYIKMRYYKYICYFSKSLIKA